MIATRFRPLPTNFFTLLACLIISMMSLPDMANAQDGLVGGSDAGAQVQEAAGETLPETSAEIEAAAEDSVKEKSIEQKLDDAFKKVNEALEPILFFDIAWGSIQQTLVDTDGVAVLDDAGQPVTEVVVVPLLIILLLAGGIFFTFRFGFINVRLFFHSIAVLRGKYDNPDDHGEITHFQALTSALSATVGLGNIAGVAIAINQGGAGAVFWMWVVAVFGMCSKFSSCTLAQVYRRIEPGGKKTEHILGGPMLYLDKGMRDMLGNVIGWPVGKVLAISFAVFAILGSLGGGNLFQVNQTAEIVSYVALDGNTDYALLMGITMAFLVALVIVGGIKRIGEVTCRIVPAMCVFYCVACGLIIASNYQAIPQLIGSIFTEAFTIKAAGWGGLMAIFVTGLKRGAFSNEAGLGSAAIAHSAAKTDEPVREGVVAMIGPFIDTIVVCTMTALTILITRGQFDESALGQTEGWTRGAAMTAEAFGTLHGYLPFMLCIAVFVFAYSTMISWSYYGERATEYLFGKAGIWPFRLVFLLFICIAPLISLKNVIGFTDLLILSMAYPNIVGMMILSPKVAKLTKDYVRRLKSGEMKPYKAKKEEIDGEPSI